MPLLQDYVNTSVKVSKEVMYELSYCYYETNQLSKAIEGFKQLSSEKDSMGQNSMYLLGDCYLRTGQKANARTAFQYCAYNSSNKKQQQVSRFNYAKLSYELGFQDIALSEMKQYLNVYPNSEYDTEAKEILVNLLASTSNFADALALYESFNRPTPSMQKVYPRILYGRAVEKVNDYDPAIRFLTLFVQSNAANQGEANASAAKYNLGYCWLKKENYKQALVFFEPVAKSGVTAASLE